MDKDHKKGMYSVQINQEYNLTLRSDDPEVQSIPEGKINIFLRNIRTGACAVPCEKHGKEKGERLITGKDIVSETQELFKTIAPGVSWTIPATESSSISTIIKFTCTNYEAEKSRMPWQFCVRTSSEELGGSRLNFDLQRVKVLSKQNRLEVSKIPLSENASKESESSPQNGVEMIPQQRVLKEEMDLLRHDFAKLQERLDTLEGQKEVEKNQ